MLLYGKTLQAEEINNYGYHLTGPDAATLKKQQKYLQYDKYFFTLHQLF